MELDVGRLDRCSDEVPLHRGVLLAHCSLDPRFSLLEVLVHECMKFVEVAFPNQVLVNFLGLLTFRLCLRIHLLLLSLHVLVHLLLEQGGVVGRSSQLVGDGLELGSGDPHAYRSVGGEVAVVDDLENFDCRCQVFVHDDEINAALFYPSVCVTCVHAQGCLSWLCCRFRRQSNLLPRAWLRGLGGTLFGH